MASPRRVKPIIYYSLGLVLLLFIIQPKYELIGLIYPFKMINLRDHSH